MALAQLELTQKPFIELQIEALAEENHIKPDRVQKFIDDLITKINSIKDLNYHKLLNRTFRLPFIGRPNSLNDDDYPKAFKFIPPCSTQVIGGYRTLTSLKRTNHVDLAVVIPAQCFEKKDVKNQRYHHKRALYLAQLAHLLNGATGFGLVDKIEYCFHHGDFLKPVIILTPISPKLKKLNITFQIFAVPEQEFAIKMSMLKPLRGNVAPKWFFKDSPLGNESVDEIRDKFIESDSDAVTTPIYNSSILFDIEAIINSDIVAEHIESGTSISQALLLIKIWLYQRELHKHCSFSMSMLLSYLQAKQKVHKNMNSFQIFKIFIKTLTEQDWTSTGLSFFEESAEKMAEFKSVFPVVFLSPSGNLNLCYNLSIDLYNRLKHEATIAMDIFNSASPDTFELLFLKKIDFMSKYDVIVHMPKCTKKFPQRMDLMKRYLDLGVFVPRLYSNILMDVVNKSLTDRIILAQINPSQLALDNRWHIKGIPYDPSTQEQTLSLGLLLNAEKSLRILDIGPDAQSDEAEEFRKFWDPKSQLRLQNGVISETVVWHVDSFSQRRAIIRYILLHALKRASLTNVVVHYTSLERLLDLKNVYFLWRDDHTVAEMKENGNMLKKRKKENDDDDDDKDVDSKIEGKPIGTGEEVFQKLLKAYNEINKVLRNIEKMKHSITSIQPTSHHLRASSVFPPLPVSLQQRNRSLKRRKGATIFPDDFGQIGKVLHIEPVEILITLDSTSKWPADFEALEAEKLDYLIQMGEALKEQDYGIKFSNDYLDVLHGQFVFRVRVRCQKELTMVTSARGKQEFQRRRYDHEVMPRVHGALDQLYREKPAYSLTCRLVKRFISCHLMTGHINDTTLDLLVAHLFLHPHPYTEPASSSSGFVRFLQLLTHHDWNEQPIVINFDSQLKVDEINRIKTAMLEERSKYPSLVVCTPYDRERLSPWTRDMPDECDLNMLRKICAKALHFYTNNVLSNTSIILEECRSLFKPNLKTFDIIIKLQNQVVQTFFASIEAPKNFTIRGREPNVKQASAFKVMPVVGLNVVEQFVGVLCDKFSNLASFYYDKYGQRVIGVIMKAESEKLLDGDIQQFMKDIKRMGTKLVESVHLKQQDK